jgi:uncharacterized membrane protein
MTRKQANLVSLVFVAVSFAVVAAFWGRLPDPMPTHWNWRGEADGFLPKPWGPLLLPLVQLGVFALFAAIPALSPRGFRVDKFGPTYARLVVLVVGFFVPFNALVVAAALGGRIGMQRAPIVLVGALFVGLGNYLGKTTRNFYVGVRTPWTLASPEVWTRTHRLAGWLFVIAGFVMMAGALLVANGAVVVLAVTIPTVLVPVVYSYVVYKRLEGGMPEDD